MERQIEETKKKVEKGFKILKMLKWKNTTLWKQTYA